MFDAQILVKKEDRSDGISWFTCSPEIVYPAVIERIKQVLKSGEFPNELVDLNTPPDSDPRGVARTYLASAKAVPPEGWKLALRARDKIYDQVEISIRAQALEVARLWLTQALHVQVGGNGTPLGIHWTNAPAFKL